MRAETKAATAGNLPFRKNNRRVDFVIAGTQKGGTTALDFYLRKHPGIGMADCKEVHFFDNEDYFRRARPPYSLYHSHFKQNGSGKLLGETTPVYMYWQDAPRRMWEYNPQLKVVVILRNPIDRAYSHWNMVREFGTETLTFWDAVQQEAERCKGVLPLQHILFSYVDRGFYAEQLRRIWRFFPRHQTLVLRNRDLREKPHETVDVVCDFLGTEPLGDFESMEVHSRPYLVPMSDRERDYLLRTFENEIRQLERMLGWDCSDWLSPTPASLQTSASLR